MKNFRGLVFLASTWTLLFWVACVGLPVGAILIELGLQLGDGTFSIAEPSVLQVAQATFLQALLSSGLAVLFGTALGIWLRPHGGPRGNFRRQAFMQGTWTQALLAVPYSIPAIVAAQAWVLWLGRAGVLAGFGLHLNWMYSLKAVVLAHVFFNLPWVALMVCQAKQEIPQGQLETAQLLGAKSWSRFRWIIWPYIRWAAASSWAQVMALCTMSFGLVLILGGGPPVQTLEVELYQRLRTGRVDFPGAVLCGFWELVISLLPWALVLFFNFKQQSFSKRLPAVTPVAASHDSGMTGATRVAASHDSGMTGATPVAASHCLGLKGLAGLTLLVFPFSLLSGRSGLSGRRALAHFRGGLEVAVALFFILPYGIILDRKVFINFWDTSWWSQVVEPLKISLFLALLTSVITVVTALCAVVSLRSLEKWTRVQACAAFLLGIPSGISILVVGLGVWLAYGKWIDPFEGSFLAIVALQVTLAFPVSLRLLLPLLKGIPDKQLEAASLLGAPTLRAFWHIEWPRWQGPIFRTLTLAAAVSLGELGAVSLFYSEKLIPLPLLISRLMQQYRFDEAQGVAGLLFILAFIFVAGGTQIARQSSPA